MCAWINRFGQIGVFKSFKILHGPWNFTKELKRSFIDTCSIVQDLEQEFAIGAFM